MVTPQSSGNQKDLNFELNLIPFIDLISVCIYFLLLTTVWIQIGTVNVSQGVGEESGKEQKPSASVWVSIMKSGDIQLSVKDSPSLPQRFREQIFKGGRPEARMELFSKFAKELKSKSPDLKTAVVVPGKE